MGDRERARYERCVTWVELTFDPVRPDPIQVVLHHATVDETAGVEHDTGAQQLDRLADLGRLSEAVQTCQQRDRIEKSLPTRKTPHDPAPRQPLQPAHVGLSPISPCSS